MQKKFRRWLDDANAQLRDWIYYNPVKYVTLLSVLTAINLVNIILTLKSLWKAGSGGS